MNNRIQTFLYAKNIKQSVFADKIGVARASVSHILAGRNNPSSDFLVRMLNTYPDLNIEWLLLGKGEMLKTTLSPAAPTQIVDIPQENPNELNLFDSPSEDEISNNPPVVANENSNMQISEPQTRPLSPIQPIVNQQVTALKSSKKVVKVVILFDDGTFQEL